MFMRKFVYILLGLCLLAPSLSAQGLKMRIANRLYQDMHYAEAITYYEDILRKSPDNVEAEEKIAHSYRKINDTQNAEKWYAKVVNSSLADPEDRLYYAQTLAANGKYEESKQWYERYATEVSADSRGAKFSEAYNRLEDFYKDSSLYRIEHQSFNSAASDFSPVMYQGGIVFCSNRHVEKRGGKAYKFSWSKTSFLDLYTAQEGKEEVKYFHQNINSQYHEGPVAFFKDGQQMVFTRNNFHKGKYRKSDDGINKLKLFFAEKQGDDWGNLKEFVYNNDNYSVGHPALSPDNQVLYFASDMPGGLGGTDLYMCRWENGQWGTPINLGKEVNSEGNEMFPFIDSEGVLYFASNGHGGLGGLDVFSAQPKSDAFFGNIQNMGAPINSQQDDFALVFDPAQNIGYFTSKDRPKAAGDDDIFKFYKKNIPTLRISGLVYHARSGAPLEQASVLLKNMRTGELVNLSTPNDGTFAISFRQGDVLEIIAVKDNFERSVRFIEQAESEQLQDGAVIRIPLAPLPPSFEDVLIYHTYYDYNKADVRPDAAAALDELLAWMEAFPEAKLRIVAHTDSRGNAQYNQKLSLRRVKASEAYLVAKGIAPARIQLDAKGKGAPANNCGPCDELQHQENRRAEYVLQLENKEMISQRPQNIVVGAKP